MTADELQPIEKEQKIMLIMRRVLTSVVREFTPAPGQPYPLSNELVEDIRQCLRLIAAHERELLEARGVDNPDRPFFSDETPATQPLTFVAKPTIQGNTDD